MEVKKMPDFMMDYVASIGDGCYSEYQGLAGHYRADIDNYIDKVYPEQNANYKAYNKLKGKDLGDLDPRSALYGIDEKYKKEALNIACKYGYERPSPDVLEHQKKMTELQEKSPVFSRFINKDEIMSDADIFAKEAHRQYFAKHPEAEKNHADMKEAYRRVEWEEKQADPFSTPYKPDKKVDKEYMESRIDDFMDKLPSSRKMFLEKDKSKDKEDIERWEL